jgi:hypothetical protein
MKNVRASTTRTSPTFDLCFRGASGLRGRSRASKLLFITFREDIALDIATSSKTRLRAGRAGLAELSIAAGVVVDIGVVGVGVGSTARWFAS